MKPGPEQMQLFVCTDPQGCHCDSQCEFPCLHRQGWAPACEACGCDPFPPPEFPPPTAPTKEDTAA